jgi:hypothetical protein
MSERAFRWASMRLRSNTPVMMMPEHRDIRFAVPPGSEQPPTVIFLTGVVRHCTEQGPQSKWRV